MYVYRWTKLFNALYLKTDADVVEDDEITSAEVKFVVKIEIYFLFSFFIFQFSGGYVYFLIRAQAN